MRSKSLFYGGEQPWQEQFCQIRRHGQNGCFSLVSLMEPCITGDVSRLLTVGLATTTLPTPRLTQRYQTMTTTSPLSPAVRSSPRSHKSATLGVVCFLLAMAFPDYFANGFFLAVLCHPSASSSKTSLKIMGCPRRLLTKCLHWR